MDIASFLGVIIGIVCVVISILLDGSLMQFFNVPSIFIVLGGGFASTLISYRLNEVINVFIVVKKAFFGKSESPINTIKLLVNLSQKARREGLLALENFLDKTDDHLMKKGLQLLVDGVDREYLESCMLSKIYQSHKRHRTGASMISMLASVAPGLGLVGTYVGLIPMLVNMRDPDKLGPLMAIELVSSFYGGFMANVIFSPMAKKLIIKSEQEKERNELILEGILSIHEGKNPKIIREELQAYLVKKEAEKISQARQKSSNENPDKKVVDYRERKGA